MDLTLILASISIVLFQLYPRDFRSRTAIAVFGAYLKSTGQILSSWPGSGLFLPFVSVWLLQFFLEVVWKVVLYPKLFSPLRKFPGPKPGSFFMGNFIEIRQHPTGVPHRKWINSIPNNGIIRYLSLFNFERLLITSPEALREVLTTKNYEFQKPSNMRFNLGRILGVGVLLAEGEEHKKQRRDLGPAFKFGHVKNLYPMFWEKSRECVEAMTAEIRKNATTTEERPNAVIEVGSWASRVTLDIIGVTGLGRDFGAIKDPNNKLNQTYQNIFKPTRQGQILGTLQIVLPAPLLDLLPVKRNTDMHSAAHVIRTTCADLIREKKERQASGKPMTLDILSAALDSKAFTDENLVDQLMTFLAAGHETTASAMTWAVYLLARHQDVQSRLRAEIHQHLPSISKEGATISHSDIDNLPYLSAVCNEVLRYYSPVPLTLREAAIDTTIAGHRVPKGTQIMLVPWAVNKSESLWGPDALEFNPERWLPKHPGDIKAASGGATSNYAYMTFLHGPRSCIGQQFAKGEFACLVGAWVGRFEFELHNKEEMDETKVEIKGGITARPSKGMYIKTTVVEGW
ncbi:cytochrome P450 4V2 [Podospora fimiseda]|uniref:Cytochrome P450 4V2 n=1 Tax=Podospora fimiseda TaxID=252190 RepID=A0AAN7BV27_9PEZI|nr:cytochrome P450 4V2 [Podospora fimiseda]